MPIGVAIPENLRRYCGGQSLVEVDGESVEEVLRALVDEFPQLAPRVVDAEGRLQHHLVVLHRDEILRGNTLSAATVSSGDELRLRAAVSGGA